MQYEPPQPSRAKPYAGTQAARNADLPASMPGDLAVELRELRARLRRAHEHAATALNASLPGRQPGEALRRFLAADAEVATIVRRIKKIQAFAKGWKDRPRGSACLI